MTAKEAVIWLINITADIGKAEHRDLWHYEQALSEIKEMLETSQPEDKCSECDAWNQYKKYPRHQWIPCKIRLPEESGTYIVTAYDGTNKRVSFVKYQKTLKRWDLTGARAYWSILAYKPLPEPWKGEQPCS